MSVPKGPLTGPAAPPSEPGAFTKLFRSPGGPSVSPEPPSAPANSGEFTRFFQSPLPESRPGGELLNRPPVGTPPPAAPSAQQDPGAFTRLFGTPSGPGKASPMPPAASSPPVLPGGATSSFSGASPGAPPAPAPPPAQSGGGEYTRLFSSPAAPPRSAPTPPPAPPPAPVQSGPSEYTRLFSSPSPQGVGPAPPAQSPDVRYARSTCHSHDSTGCWHAGSARCGLSASWRGSQAPRRTRSSARVRNAYAASVYGSTPAGDACATIHPLEHAGDVHTRVPSASECHPLHHSGRSVFGCVVPCGLSCAEKLSQRDRSCRAGPSSGNAKV